MNHSFPHDYDPIGPTKEVPDEYFEENIQEPSGTMVLLAAFGYILYAFAVLFGIPCNLFVLFRMTRLSKVCSDVYSNGAGVCLFVMAISDIVSLSSISVHYFLSIRTENFSFTTFLNETMQNLLCKGLIFCMHVSTSLSIWSWLLMSTLRYLSVYHPLLYIRLWQVPKKALLSALCVSCIVNCWLLISVTYDPYGSCTLTAVFGSPMMNRILLFIEILWSFILPTVTILFMDSSVYFCRLRINWKDDKNVSMSDLRRNVVPRVSKQKNSHYLWRWMVIALIDVVLNAPENLNRLTAILGYTPYSDYETYMIQRTFAQVLYYLQFAFNGVYLALFIYDKSTRPVKKCRILDTLSHNNAHDHIHSHRDSTDKDGLITQQPPLSV